MAINGFRIVVNDDYRFTQIGLSERTPVEVARRFAEEVRMSVVEVSIDNIIRAVILANAGTTPSKIEVTPAPVFLL